MRKDTTINIRLDQDTKDKISLEAKKENRSVSNWVVWIIRRFLSGTKSDK